MITTDDIVSSLRDLGLSRGDRVVVHSSLRSMGRVSAGAKTVVDAFVSLLGPNGLLVVPTFTYSGTLLFDPLRSASKTGAISEAARQWPGAVRSLHPTHSVAAIGDGARDLCADHHHYGGLGKGSPLDRLASLGGKVLLLGVTHTANSTIHIGEAHSQAPYVHAPSRPNAASRATITLPDGDIEVEILAPPGCSRAFGAIEGELRRAGAIRDGFVGDAMVQLMMGCDVISAAVNMLNSDPSSLLCTDPTCDRCRRARQWIAC